MKENIDRFSYVNNLILAKDTPVVKIITGIRRCGKSTIMLLFLQELKKLGVKDENIIYISFESLKNQYIQNHIDLYNRICKLRKNTNENFYLLLDELQNVES